MIEILESPNYLVALKISGELTASDVESAYKAAEKALKENERISFFLEVEDSTELTIEGLWKDAVNGIAQIGKLRKCFRIAVVTDLSWIAALSRVEGLMFSSIDMRVFEGSERDKALAWASAEPKPLPKPSEITPSIHLIQTTNDKVFAYEVDGPIREDDIKVAISGVKEAFDRHEKINVLARMNAFTGFDLSAVLNDELFRLKYKALSKVERYAVVCEKSWLRNLLELINPLISPTIRVFEPSEEAAAWEWVGSQQALLAE